MCRGKAVKVLLVLCWAFVLTSMVTASERVLYVDAAATGAHDGSSWNNAYVGLQVAFDAAATIEEPVEIRIAQGVYKPTEDIDGPVSFEAIGGILLLRGGYAGVEGINGDERDVERYTTVLNSQVYASDSGVIDAGGNVVTVNQADAEIEIEGLTFNGNHHGIIINQGRVTVRDVMFTDNNRGLELNGGSIILTNCTFVDNTNAAEVSGGELVMTDCLFEKNFRGIQVQQGNLVLTRCTFKEHESATVKCQEAELHQCVFTANRSNFGVLKCNGSLTADQCVFTANRSTALSCQGAETTLTDCQFIDNEIEEGVAVLKANGINLKVTRCAFIGNAVLHARVGSATFLNRATFAEVSHCVFVGNSGFLEGPGAFESAGSDLTIANCTFADNRGFPPTLNARNAKLTGCIIRDGSDPFTPAINYSNPQDLDITYCNVQGGYPGQGNVDVDPEFVQLGYWADPNDRTVDVGIDDFYAIWVMGDYHLKSQAGHWDVGIEDWVYDDVTSPCIDAADPNSPIGDEVFPNGGYPNMGAYGGTTQASRTYFGGPVCETQMAGDINGDCVVDQTDLDILMAQWLIDSTELENQPPSVVLLAPQEGDVFNFPTDRVILRAEVGDVDGSVVQLQFHLDYRDENSARHSMVGPTVVGSILETEITWNRINKSGVYTVWATAVDDQGAITSTPRISITINRW